MFSKELMLSCLFGLIVLIWTKNKSWSCKSTYNAPRAECVTLYVNKNNPVVVSAIHINHGRNWWAIFDLLVSHKLLLKFGRTLRRDIVQFADSSDIVTLYVRRAHKHPTAGCPRAATVGKQRRADDAGTLVSKLRQHLVLE